MKKDDFIKWWVGEALRTWDTACYNMDGGHNLFALFAFHLTIEKLLKAAWIKDNVDDVPPRTHDLIYIYNQTDLALEAVSVDYLLVIGNWNIESRYPDYRLKVYQKATNSYLTEHLARVNTLKEQILHYVGQK